MSEYDGDIQLSVSLKPGDIKASAQKLAQSVKSIFENNAGQNLDKSLQKVMSTMDKVNSKAQSVQEKMKVLEHTQIPTKEYQALQNELDKLNTKGQQLYEQQQKIGSSGSLAKMSKEYIQAQQACKELEIEQERIISQMKEMESAGTAFTAGTASDKYAKYSDELANLNNQQRINIATYQYTEAKLNSQAQASERAANGVKKVSSATKSASKNVKTFGNSLNSASKSASGFNINIGKIFKKILMYGFGIRSVYILIRKLRQAIADGLKSMAQMNNGANETNTAISQLSTSFYAFKNSIAAAVAPLVNLLAPALSRIIDLLTSAMNAVASFIAALTGKSSFMKATKVQQNFAGSLDKTAGSAKKAKKELQQLAGFDELNVLHKQEDENSGGGGGGGTAPAFEEVKIDPKILDMVNRLKEAWEKIKDYLNVLKDAFMSGFWEAMGDWQSKVDDIKKNLAIIGKDLKEIATDPAVLAAADNWAKSFAHMLGTTAGMFASIGLTLAQNLIGGFAKFLEDKKGEIKQWLIDMFDVKAALYNQISQFEVALARIFDVFGQEAGQKLTANILGIYWEVWSNLLLLGAKVGRDLVTLLTQPIIDNTEGFRSAFNGLLEIAAGAAETIKETLDSVFADVQTLYDEHIKPLFDSLTKAISWVVSLILSAWEQSIKPVLMDLQAKFKTMMEQHIAPAFTKISRLIGSLVDLIKTVFVPIIELLGVRVRLMISMIMPILQNAWTIVMERIGLIMDIIGDLADVIADMVDFVVAVLTGDWASAWESARAIVDDTVTLMTDLIKAKANMIISTVEGLINAVIGMINGLADGIVDVLGGLEFNIPDWVPVYGGKEFSIPAHIPHVSQVHFPRLAQGAVIPPNKEFMAVLGDQTSGTNIETPLDTMIEAFNAAKGDEEALLREQNDILRQLLYKEWRLDPKDVFNATRAQNQDFIRRTGKSAFAY